MQYIVQAYITSWNTWVDMYVSDNEIDAADMIACIRSFMPAITFRLIRLEVIG